MVREATDIIGDPAPVENKYSHIAEAPMAWVADQPVDHDGLGSVRSSAIQPPQRAIGGTDQQ